MNDDSKEAKVIWELLRKHVPEVTTGVIRVLGIVRKPGKRTAIAVSSSDPRCDPVGTCVGMRGERAKRIVAELGEREMFDVIRWDESAERFIGNLLAPLRVVRAVFDDATREARVEVVQGAASRPPELAVRSRLLMNLTGWKLQVEVRQEG